MKRHPLDTFSLLAGTVLTVVALLSLTTGLDHDLVTSDVFWPFVLIGLGVIALAATIGTNRREADGADDGQADATLDVPEQDEPVES